MSSKLASRLPGTAAWRFSILSTVAFAVGTAAAFGLVDLVVERGILERSDDWLVGETGLLAQVVEATPSGERYETFVEEVAELAQHEVAPSPPGAVPAGEPPVFFFVTRSDGTEDLWVGPGENTAFLSAVRSATWRGMPQSIEVAGWSEAFRVMGVALPDGGRVFLGYIDYNALALLERLRYRFLQAWLGMLAFGFIVSFVSARRILRRVDRISDIAARIGGHGVAERVLGEHRGDEIGRLASTFNQMLGRIEAAVEQTRSVTDGVAHDLRSPLTAIRGNLELSLTSGDPERVEEAAVGAVDGVDRLLRVINTSLDVAEAEAGALKLVRQDIDLAAMVTDMVDFYRPAAEENGLVFDTEVDGVAMASVDPDLVRRALGNLLDNAIQHLPAGCKVCVSARANGNTVVLGVRDDGPGFTKQQKNRAFERFFRGPGSRGHGLGLALVRAVALAHGGEARIVDHPGGGACIELLLPTEAACPSI